MEQIAVRNFQSLRVLDLDLGRLTVIVGPSNSGKTALMRALRAVASNLRGSDAITRGAKAAAITVRTAQRIITLERTESSGLYRVVDLADGSEEVYTKLAGGVPEAVTTALGIAPAPIGGTSVNFAGQLDRPYLLDDSGANVARELGELTNVTTIFEAVRQANRRRNSLAGVLRTRQADLVNLTTQAMTFRGLPGRLAICDEAEQIDRRMVALGDQTERLRKAISTLQIAESVLARTSVLPQVPADASVLAVHARLNAFQTLVRTWSEANTAVAAAQNTAQSLAGAEQSIAQELHETLLAAGTCPTCRQRITEPVGVTVLTNR